MTIATRIELNIRAPLPNPVIQTPLQRPFLLGRCSNKFLMGAKYPNPRKNPKPRLKRMTKTVKFEVKERRKCEKLMPVTAINELILYDNLNI